MRVPVCFTKDENVGNKRQSERLAFIEKEIINPRNQAVGIIFKYYMDELSNHQLLLIISLLNIFLLLT